MDSKPCRNFPGYANVKIIWKLKNFSGDYFNNPNFNTFQSPVFRIQLNNYNLYKFKLIAMRNRNTMNIFLRTHVEDNFYSDHSSLQIHYEMKVKDFFIMEYKNKISGKIEKIYFEEKLGKCLSSRELKRSTPQIIKDKTVEIVILLRLIEKYKNSTVLQSTILSQQYEKLFNNQKYSDFSLLTSDDEEIFVHKNILSIRSPVFEAMVNTKLQEGETNKAKIDDIDAKSLIELIRFIYCGRVNEIDSMAKELLYAAGKYDLEDLKPLCIKSLAVNISCENAIHTFILADLHREENLKRFAMEFIKFEYEKIKNSKTWECMTQDQLKALIDHLMEKNNENMNINLVTTITIQPRTQQIVVDFTTPAQPVGAAPAH